MKGLERYETDIVSFSSRYGQPLWRSETARRSGTKRNPENRKNLKAEFFIPLMVNKLINDGTSTCEVLDTTSKWFGVTYAADREATVARIQELVDEGVYPDKMF